jgi:serine/threonine protein kinase
MNEPLASQLEGKTVGKWKVLAKRQRTEEDSSGRFSSCYMVEDGEGNAGFLKALNYIYAFEGEDSTTIMEAMTSNFNYERDLLQLCREKGMKRVVTAIDNGEYREPGQLPVPYLVFEMAEGSLKTKRVVENPDLAWKLIAFHGALVGISQLHKERIAHQDIKPSNILIFGKNYSKIADLGNATQLGNPSSRWTLDGPAGDLRFAPVELLYGYCSNDWATRRYGADLFMLGGILSFMLTGLLFLTTMLRKVPDIWQYYNFGGNYEEVKPVLMMAYHQALNEVSGQVPQLIRRDLVEVIAELSHPIPEERGNPKRLLGKHQPFSLQRYVTLIDRLAKKVMYAKL